MFSDTGSTPVISTKKILVQADWAGKFALRCGKLNKREEQCLVFEYIEYTNKKVSDDDLLDDIRRVSKMSNKSTLTIKEYDSLGKYNSRTILRRFGTWHNACLRVGIEVNESNIKHTKKELFENIAQVWINKGRQPARRDMDNTEISKISSGSYVRAFKSWNNALKEFVDFANKSDYEYEVNEIETSESKMDKRSRDINLRLRFRVMQRDNFRCCICGASPAKDPNVELHIDHIIPWSKGGETTIDNLQTLCSKCNLGKSDLSM